MSLDTARAAVRFVALRGDRAPEIGFFGVEPLVEPRLVEEIALLARAAMPGVALSLNTNGTLFTARVLGFCREHGVRIALSLDGGPAAQDAGRPLPDGRGSFFLIARHVGDLAGLDPPVHVRPTFGPSRAGRLDADVREIFDLGFRRLSLGFDLTASYGEDRLRALEGSIGRLVDWYAAELGRGRDIAIPSLDGIGTDREVPRRGLFCGAGDSLLAVDTDGTVVPCWRYAGERRRRIGDVFGGIDDEKRRPFVEFEAAAMPSCRGCRHARRCGRCAWVAERHSGGLDRMPPEACRVLGAVGDAGLRLAERLIAEHNPIFLSRLRDRALRARSSGDRVLVETPGGLVAALDREVLKRYRID